MKEKKMLAVLFLAIVVLATNASAQVAHPQANAARLQTVSKPDVTLPELIMVGSHAVWRDPVWWMIFCEIHPTALGCPLFELSHYTIIGDLVDLRSASIPLASASVWIVHDSGNAFVWAMASVDSVTANRCYFAVPRCVLQIPASALSSPGKNLIPAQYWPGGTADESALPSAVYNVVSGAAITGAITELRPEDAKYATTRAQAALNTGNLNGLGYGPTPIGTPILSSVTSSSTFPVAFNITGKDPITNVKIPPYQTVNVGAAPVVLMYNDSDANGLGQKDGSGNPLYKNVNHSVLTSLLNGTLGRSNNLDTVPAGSNNVPLTVLLQEPLSGSMNTIEFDVTRDYAMLKGSGVMKLSSQEAGVNPSAPGGNPLNLSGPGGSVRRRALGDDEAIKCMGGFVNGCGPNSISYAGFSFVGLSSVAGATGVGRYVTVDGVDPFFANPAANPNGPNSYILPTCSFPCPAASGVSFPNVRNGSYPDLVDPARRFRPKCTVNCPDVYYNCTGTGQRSCTRLRSVHVCHRM